MMKKRILLFLSIFCCLGVRAQDITYPESVKQLMEQAANANRNVQTIEQKAPTQRFVNNQQQAQNRLPGQTVQQYLSNPYAPLGGARYGNPYGMSPKEYGEYLMRTGKDKQNKRKRQKIARGIA